MLASIISVRISPFSVNYFSLLFYNVTDIHNILVMNMIPSHRISNQDLGIIAILFIMLLLSPFSLAY